MILQTHYNNKPTGYFDTARLDLLNLIPHENKNKKILEIGAGSGATLLYAKENGYAKYVCGIDICSMDDSHQNHPLIDQFIISNVEKIELPFDENSIDVIICGDVLEHLIDPYNFISKLKKILKPDGVLITSIPNIREWHIIFSILIKGDFTYQSSGIMDKTHLRFFCKKNIKKLFTENDMKISKCISNIEFTGHKKKIFNNLTNKIFEEFLTVQYYCVVKK